MAKQTEPESSPATVVEEFHALAQSSPKDALALYLAHHACFPPHFFATAFSDSPRLQEYFTCGERLRRVLDPPTAAEFDRFCGYVERAQKAAETLDIYDIVTGVLTLLIPWERFSETLQCVFLTSYLPTFSAAFQQEFAGRMQTFGLRNPLHSVPRWV